MPEQVLNRAQKLAMLQHYWLPYEIEAFANAKTPDGKAQHLAYTSAPFQAMIIHRMEYANKRKKLGEDDLTIRRRILMLYGTRRGKASPWDFLKIEYQPIKPMTDYIWNVKMQAKQRIARTLGKGYGKHMQRSAAPRYAPVVRQVPGRAA